MSFRFRSVLMGAALAAVLVALAPLAHAGGIDYVYTYTGNPFTSFSDVGTGYTCLPADGPCAIQASFTLSGPLGDNFGGNVQPLSYSVTDGTNVFNDSNSSIYISDEGVLAGPGLSISTNASGQVTSWYFEVLLDAGTAWNLQSSPDGDGAQAYTEGFAGNSNEPGTWVGSQVTPEPPTWALFGAGALTLLGLAVRKRWTGLATTAA